MKLYVILFLTILTVMGCGEDVSQETETSTDIVENVEKIVENKPQEEVKEGNDKHLTGDWRGVVWTVNGKPSAKTPRSAILRFNGNGQYLGDLGSKPERGSYVVDGNELKFTKSDNTKITSVIERLKQDTLILNLSHRGNPEQITFIRRY